MYIRFQGLRQNDVSVSKLGIFQLAFELKDEFDLPQYAEEELLANIQWLRKHLKSPEVLREEGRQRAISWFKDSATKPMTYIRSIKVLLEEYGYHIEQVQTQDPGTIIYEDGWQVVAVPK